MAYYAGLNAVDSIMVDIIDSSGKRYFCTASHNISYGELSNSMLALFGFSVGMYAKRMLLV
jgi:hypothetical protein